MMNVGLALFNMLPVPPLDGSRVVDGLLPYRWRGTWEQYLMAGPFLLIGLFVFGGRLIAGPQSELSNWLLRLLSP
jgi:Zn-dependent protease